MIELNFTLESFASPICFRRNFKSVLALDFFKDVAISVAQTKSSKKSIVLSFEDPYLFIVGLFACLNENKTIIILPNNKVETINQFKSDDNDVWTDDTIQKYLESSGTSHLNSELTTLKINPDNKIVFFTSGSTGTPKKIEKRIQHLLNEINTLEKTFGKIIDNHFVCSSVSHQHIYGLIFKVLWPIFCKRPFLIDALEFPEQLIGLEKFQSRFVFVSTPSFLKRTYLPDTKFNQCAVVFSSGGMLEYETSKEVSQVFGVVPTEVYGSTETGGIGYRQQVSENQFWTPFLNINVKPNKLGQLVVQSPYFAEAEITMGDQASFSEVGFKLLGRTDDVVKIEEKRVSLTEISRVILKSGMVSDVTTVYLQKGNRQQSASVIVLNQTGQEFLKHNSEKQLILHLQKHLLNYFDKVVVPRTIKIMERLPYNTQSKLLKNELLELLHEV